MKGIIVSALFAAGVSLLVIRFTNQSQPGGWLSKAAGRG
jgi:hypothetical protein